MYWMLAAAAVSVVGSIMTKNSSESQNSSNLALNTYNANAAYNNSVSNIQSQNMLAGMNAAFTMSAASVNANAAIQVAGVNADIIAQTTAYNSSLLDEELVQLWDGMDLDLQVLENQRVTEKGTLIANQAASGTVIGEGSNADSIVHQQTQAALDELIVRHNADIGAAEILNAQAQGEWEGEMQIRKTIWEGNLNASTTMANATAQAGSTLASAAISGIAGLKSAGSAYQSSIMGADTNYSNTDDTIQTNFANGLFSAGSTAIKGTGSTMETSGGSLIA